MPDYFWYVCNSCFVRYTPGGIRTHGPRFRSRKPCLPPGAARYDLVMFRLFQKRVSCLMVIPRVARLFLVCLQNVCKMFGQNHLSHRPPHCMISLYLIYTSASINNPKPYDIFGTEPQILNTDYNHDLMLSPSLERYKNKETAFNVAFESAWGHQTARSRETQSPPGPGRLKCAYGSLTTSGTVYLPERPHARLYLPPTG